MKQHLSVLMLAARSTLYKLLGLFLIMAAAESVLFYITMQKAQAEGLHGLEQMITQSRLALVCGVCFLLVCTLLSLTGCELFGSKLRYTIKRLSVREGTTVLWWAVYNILIFFVFWAVQLLIVLLLCRFYTSTLDPAQLSDQTMFLAFYRHKFLHSLLPLAETSRYIRNVILILGLGVSSACFSFRQRQNQKGIAIFLLAVVTVLMFSREMGSFGNDIFMMLIVLVVAGSAVVNIWKEPGDEN